MPAPAVTIFLDVNETLSDLGPVAEAFHRVGAERELAATWFASVLRDGFALTVTESPAIFLDIATDNARALLRQARLDVELHRAVDTVMTAFQQVKLHPDVAPGLRTLHEAGHRLFTLSNGPTSTAERLLRDGGVLDTFDGLLTVEDHTAWKPVPAAYLQALKDTETMGSAYLVAVHPWDTHGASTAGLSTGWINRFGESFPEHFDRPTLVASSLTDFAEQLDEGPKGKAHLG
jgi:2-haloacid dehalogenase